MSLTPGLTGLLEAVQSMSTTELAFLLLFLAGALWLLKLILTMRVWLFILILFPIVWFLSSAGQSNCLLSSRSWVRILQEPPNASVMELVDIADLKSVGHNGRASSSLAGGTKIIVLQFNGKTPGLYSAQSPDQRAMGVRIPPGPPIFFPLGVDKSS